MKDQKGLKQLSKDLYHDRRMEFDGVSGNDAMREIILEACGGEFTPYNFERNKVDIYEIIGVAVDAVAPEVLTTQFDGLADVRNVATGDKPKFKVSDPRIIRVGRIAAGNRDMRRQTITGKSFTIETDWYSAAVYAELEQFIAGEIDWAKLIDKVNEGFSARIQTAIFEALTDSYSLLQASDKIEGKATLDGLLKLAERIQTKARRPVAIYGTKLALNKVAKMADMSGSMKDELNTFGYLGTVSGMRLIEIPQAFKVNSDEFALSDDTLLILPEGEKVVGVVFEGDAMVNEPEGMSRHDMQLGFETLKKIGISVLQLKVYGMAKLAA